MPAPPAPTQIDLEETVMKKPQGKKFLTFILMVLAMNTIYVLPYLMYTYYLSLIHI